MSLLHDPTFLQSLHWEYLVAHSELRALMLPTQTPHVPAALSLIGRPFCPIDRLLASIEKNLRTHIVERGCSGVLEPDGEIELILTKNMKLGTQKVWPVVSTFQTTLWDEKKILTSLAGKDVRVSFELYEQQRKGRRIFLGTVSHIITLPTTQ
ncbi:hypothetical protein M422DRAFT_270396 [Sphaerobolus stellatus SS14]|uniref:Uncharacterized protein n=1 Tax=Sphaerobolus stellatus (strain SS14) TaxID=990650 RepID=A0A0C9USL1_SPHS4|nr:hypothetical protein M422DRAFT_270396 [Sphaerobolus stellatus SS14]